jgi:hypothetical protein
MELIEAGGTGRKVPGASAPLIANVIVYKGFAVVERGPGELDNHAGFSLDEYIHRRPAEKRTARLVRSVRRTRLAKLFKKKISRISSSKRQIRRGSRAAKVRCRTGGSCEGFQPGRHLSRRLRTRLSARS